MDVQNEENRRSEFRKILFSLAQHQDMFQNKAARYSMYKQLEDLYYIDTNLQFRHYYSDVFSVLTQINTEPNAGDINILGQNIDLLRIGYQPKNKDKNGKLIDISDNIKKLYDHVSLDIARISYSIAQDRETSGEENIKQLQARIISIENKIPKTECKIEETEKKLCDSQKEYIAILGIFSAVVLAFTGGVAFSSSVLENIHQSSIYRTVFICCIIGFVLIDVVFLMFRYIEKIVHNSESKRGFKQYIPIIVLNATIILIMILTVVAWKTGWVEHRNQEIIKTLTIL